MEVIDRIRSISAVGQQRSLHLWMILAIVFLVISIISWIWPMEPLLSISLPDRYLSPGSVRSDGLRSWLGSDALGRDVLASLIVATPYALLVGLLSAGLSAVVALLVGALVAHFREGIQLPLHSVLLAALSMVVLLYGMAYRTYLPSLDIISPLVILLLASISMIIGRYRKRLPHVQLSVDRLFLAFAEIFRAVPALLMILVIVAVCRLDHSLSLVALLVFFLWVSMARVVRAEALSVREKDYLAAGDIMGYSTIQLLWRHYAPNVLPALLVAASYAMAAAIILEATLSFLGIYTPDHPSWGAQLQGAKDNITAWWLAIFPGFMIFLVLTMAQSFADWVRSRR